MQSLTLHYIVSITDKIPPPPKCWLSDSPTYEIIEDIGTKWDYFQNFP